MFRGCRLPTTPCKLSFRPAWCFLFGVLSQYVLHILVIIEVANAFFSASDWLDWGRGKSEVLNNTGDLYLAQRDTVAAAFAVFGLWLLRSYFSGMERLYRLTLSHEAIKKQVGHERRPMSYFSVVCHFID